MFLKNLVFLSAKCTFMCSQLHRGLRSSFIVHFTSITPQKTPGRSTVRDFYVEFGFLGLGCEHAVLEQLEVKNLSKRATCCQKQPILGGFWLLAALELMMVDFLPKRYDTWTETFAILIREPDKHSKVLLKIH